MLGATTFSVWQINTDREHIGEVFVLKREDSKVPFRAAAYARLSLTESEEEFILHWNLFPHRSNEKW
jgi:hypothetical protein